MSDPLDGILTPPGTPPAPAPAPDPTPPPAPAPAPGLSAEEVLEQNRRLQEMLERQGSTINDLRSQVATALTPPAPNEDPNAQFWQDPTQNTQRIVEQTIAQHINPQAKSMNEKLGRFAIDTYLRNKAADPYYTAVAPIFQKQIASIPVDQIGAAPDAAVQQMLDVAWNAAVGQYAQDYTRNRPAPPPNLGGSGSGGSGPNGKKTLAEIDAKAYNWAMANGLSAEKIQEIADEIAAEGN